MLIRPLQQASNGCLESRPKDGKGLECGNDPYASRMQSPAFHSSRALEPPMTVLEHVVAAARV